MAPGRADQDQGESIFSRSEVSQDVHWFMLPPPGPVVSPLPCMPDTGEGDTSCRALLPCPRTGPPKAEFFAPGLAEVSKGGGGPMETEDWSTEERASSGWDCACDWDWDWDGA